MSKPRNRRVLRASEVGVGVGAGALETTQDLGGLPTRQVAEALGISQQRASQIETSALLKLSQGCRKEKFRTSAAELRGPRGARNFTLALTHALAEKRLAEHYGITVRELQVWLAEYGIDSKDPTTWTPS